MTEQQAVDLVYLEARLIDEKRLDEWYELYTDDALYWIPLVRGQAEGMGHTSLSYEDKLLLKVRIERLKSPKAYSQNQPSFCQHVLQQPDIQTQHPDGYEVRTPFMYMETQLDDQIVLCGVAFHHLVKADDRLKIRQKKIELLNCDAALPSIQMFL